MKPISIIGSSITSALLWLALCLYFPRAAILVSGLIGFCNLVILLVEWRRRP